jgi:predicted negative regulator of RcsB-dependent stress response
VDDLLTDQQQAEQVRGWLRQNGMFLAVGVGLGLLALFGFNQWNRFQEQKAVDASAFYETFLQSVRAGQLEQAEAGMATLAADFGSSPYADQGRLAMARLFLDQAKADKAVEYLRQVADGGHSAEIRSIGRLRLARVLAYQEKYDEALAALKDPGAGAFAAAFHDVRGDVYFAMGRQSEARSEYQQALNSEAAAGLVDRTYVQAKLDDLGGAAADLAVPAPTTAPAP